jgi:hypothetical protein
MMYENILRAKELSSNLSFNSDQEITSNTFLAYFQILKKYAIVRTLSVRPSVRLSVRLSSILLLRGSTEFVLFGLNRWLMIQGPEPRKEFFLGPVLGLGEAF